MTKLFQTTSKLAPGLFPDTLKLIKTKANHFGVGVWYTRENSIVIPFNELASRKKDNFVNTIAHELFHIYSRYHPETRKSLYHLIGFRTNWPKKLVAATCLGPPRFNQPRWGGCRTKNQSRHARRGNDPRSADRLCQRRRLSSGPRRVFRLLGVWFVPNNPERKRTWSVLTKDDGYSSNLENWNGLTDFFRQIRKHRVISSTTEILADNFSFILREKNNPAYTAKFSKPGKQLLTDMEKKIKETK